MDRYTPSSYQADDDATWDTAAPGNYARRGTGRSRPLPPPPPPGDLPPPRRRRPQAAPRRAHLAREIIETLVLTVLIFVAIRFSVQTFRVEGPSMRPGLHDNEYVLVNKLAYLFHGPMRGDVIVFQYPKDPTQDFIKRVIGLPGDTISWNTTQVFVNGVALKEPYLSTPSNLNNQPAFTLPANQYFVMGDNRPQSTDSRTFGPVPLKDVIAQIGTDDCPND